MKYRVLYGTSEQSEFKTWREVENFCRTQLNRGGYNKITILVLK